MINPDDIKVGMVLGQADAMILRAAVARLNSLELEILTLRKAFSETAVYEAEINGVMSSVTKSHYEDCKKYGVKTRQLIVKPSMLKGDILPTGGHRHVTQLSSTQQRRTRQD